MYRIYINESVFILAESVPPGLKNYQEIDNQEFNFLKFYEKIKTGATPGVYLLVNSGDDNQFKKIKKSFRIIKAAGGLVSNEENKYLFIFRRGKWDLPKGKIDPGEKTRDAAVREVEEECGITITKSGKKFADTWHTYELNGQKILKKTTWYYMKAYKQGKLIPQLEEDITEVKWVAKGDFGMIRKNTYPLIRDIMGGV